jgi:hypothetical protein
MEIKINETQRMDLVHRAVALGLAFVTTSFIATSVAVVFTGNTQTFGSALVQVALAPFRAVLGG